MSTETALDYTLSSADADTDAEVVVRTALAAGAAVPLGERGHYAFRTFDGDVKVITGPEPRPAPDRKTGTAKLYDATSFAAYFNKHHEADQSELYADPYAPTVVAVLNGNGERTDADVDPTTGFGDHRAVLLFKETVAWSRWAGLNGQLLDQVKFAEHLEASLPDIVTPDGAQMLELAQSFQAKTKVQFESAKDLGSGQRQLVYREEVQATAGVKGDITIPREFVIGVAPYEGSSAYRITARLRYRLNEGRLTIGYALDRPEDILRAAFDDVLVQVQDGTGRIALLGTPPA